MTLNLRIKRKYLFEIVRGTKKIEYRALSLHYASRFLLRQPGTEDGYHRDGFVYFKRDIEAIRFYDGPRYNATVELLKIDIEGDDAFRLHLGRVLSTNVETGTKLG